MPKNKHYKKTKKEKGKGKHYKKTRKYRKYRRNTGKGHQITRRIQRKFMQGATPITDLQEKRILAEALRLEKEREIIKNDVMVQNAELERRRNQIQQGFAATPMDPQEIKRQIREDELYSKWVNSKKVKSKKLDVRHLGGSS